VNSRSRPFILLILWCLEVSGAVLGTQEDWINAHATAERERVRTYWGAVRERGIAEATDVTYRRWFVDDGLVAGSYSKLLPPKSPSADTLTLAPWFFSWLKTRLDTLWILIYQGVFRAYTLGLWLKFLALPLAAAAVDGYVTRQIKRANRRYASADQYAMARTLVFILMAAPLLYLPLPLNIDPIFVPVWGACLMLAIRGLVANAQHHI
jgi:Domain of unknown function (DUF4400)